MALLFTNPLKAAREVHDRKVARCHKILEEIQDRAVKLQRAADDLPPNEADMLFDQAEILLEAADEMMVKVEELEQKR